MVRETDYEAPRLVELGSVAELVQAQEDGAYLDADYPAGTPKGSLTFSG